MAQWSAPLGQRGKLLLVVSMVSGLVTHAYHLFVYPLYLTDEGIYMQRAWSVISETRLSPYTYTYDHAPGGWLTIAAMVLPLPHQFELFHNAVNTGRVLMVIVHVASVFLLFEITRKLSGGSVLAASVAAFLFNFSPLAVYFQRQVLLDNLMVFWMFLAMYIVLKFRNRIVVAMGAGLALGVALITKENAIFFLPGLIYLLHCKVRGVGNRRFSVTFWTFALAAPVGAYLMYAELKNELLPSGIDFSLTKTPGDHVSLLYAIWWQLHRQQGTLLSPGSFLYVSWLPKDQFLLIAGFIAAVICVYLGMRDREKNLGLLVVGVMALSYGFYLFRGSVLLDFYVTPLIPLFAMTVGLVVDRLTKPMNPLVSGGLVVLGMCAMLVLPSIGYLIAYSDKGQPQLADRYRLNVTELQDQQLAWMREHIPTNARIVMDDDIWLELHDQQPYYPYAHSHYNAAADPDVRDKLFARNWQNIDYVVMSNQMMTAMQLNNGNGNENYIMDALNHSTRVWQVRLGDIELEIDQVQKQ